MIRQFTLFTDIHMDPNVTADWILEVLHNQENILNRKLTATREKETGLKVCLSSQSVCTWHSAYN